jgi:glucose-1-phosphate thymidylyltransferase
MVEIDHTGHVTRHVDKPAETLLTLMWGLAVWEPTFTELIHDVRIAMRPTAGRPELVLGDCIDEALARGLRVAGVQLAGGFYVDIGTYDEIVEAQRKILEVQT